MKKHLRAMCLMALLLLVATPMMAGDFNLGTALEKFYSEMGFTSFFIGTGWKNLVMLAVGCVLLYLAIKKEYEPLLLLPIAFGMILTNLPGAGLFHTEMWNDEFLNPDSPYYHSYRHVMAEGGLLDVLYIGVKAGIYPCLIFLGVGAMTDFGPLIANPKSLLLGAAAQLGIFATFTSSALMPRRLRLSVLSVVPTVPLPSSSPPSWLPTCWVPSLWPLTAIWHSCL